MFPFSVVSLIVSDDARLQKLVLYTDAAPSRRSRSDFTAARNPATTRRVQLSHPGHRGIA